MVQSAFQKFIEILNNHNIGDIIFRSNCLYELNKIGVQLKKSTFDNYRRTLTREGYLRSCWPGQYRILKKVPFFLNTTGKTIKETSISKTLKLLDQAHDNYQMKGKKYE